MKSGTRLPQGKLWVLVGTRAEYIKLSQLLRLLELSHTPYSLVETGQHYPQTESVRSEFAIRAPDIVIRPINSDWGIVGKLLWLVLILFDVLRAKRLREGVFGSERRIAVIQGDTVSTLLGMLIAMRLGFDIYHIESGLTSGNLFTPFPEEIIRRLVCQYSDQLFAPSKEAYCHILKFGHSKTLYNTGVNTGADACVASLERSNQMHISIGRNVLVAIHRLENIYMPPRLRTILKVLRRLSEGFHIRIVGYHNTMIRIPRIKLGRELLLGENVHVVPLQSHSVFLAELMRSACVVTDGGTIQEECFYMRVPCAVLRNRTERPDCINDSVSLHIPFTGNVDNIVDWVNKQADVALQSFRSKRVTRNDFIDRIKSKLNASPTNVIFNSLVSTETNNL